MTEAIDMTDDAISEIITRATAPRAKEATMHRLADQLKPVKDRAVKLIGDLKRLLEVELNPANKSITAEFATVRWLQAVKLERLVNDEHTFPSITIEDLREAKRPLTP